MRIRTLMACVAVGFVANLSTAQTLTPIAEGLKLPVDMVEDPTQAGRFYIVEQKPGQILVMEDGEVKPDPFLVIDRATIQPKDWEQGLLGMDFDPNYATNKRFYVNYTAKRTEKRRDPGKTHIARYTAASPYKADADSGVVLLEIEQPYPNHNGGCIRFGPDGMLYIGMGDGGAANDPKGYAQNMDSLLGKILRIDVATGDDTTKYGIPDDNPFVNQDDVRDEIWASGVRNPWGMEFDSDGNLWFGDVGQNRYEEISMVPAGEGGLNFGWKDMEGFRNFKPRRPGTDSKDPPKLSHEDHEHLGFEPPVWEYRHWHPAGARMRYGSVTGGFVYEGSDVPSLSGRYIFADFMFGKVWSFRMKNGRADDVSEHSDAFARAFDGGDMTFAISRFTRDAKNELYVLDHKNGRVLKIVQNGV